MTAEGTLVQQETSQVGRVIESRPIRQLPLPDTKLSAVAHALARHVGDRVEQH